MFIYRCYKKFAASGRGVGRGPDRKSHRSTSRASSDPYISHGESRNNCAWVTFVVIRMFVSGGVMQTGVRGMAVLS